MGMERNPEAGLLVAAGPVSKGISKTRANVEMTKVFMDWADNESYIGKYHGKAGAYADLKSKVVPWLEALRLNGYDPEVELKAAISAAWASQYEKAHNALPLWTGGNVKERQLDEAARGLFRLNGIGRNFKRSLKARDKIQNIKRDSDLSKITNKAIYESFHRK